jgi:hypothetical protein
LTVEAITFCSESIHAAIPQAHEQPIERTTRSIRQPTIEAFFSKRELLFF